MMGPQLERNSAMVTAEVWVLLTAPLSAHASASMKEPQRALNSVCRRNNRTRSNHKNHGHKADRQHLRKRHLTSNSLRLCCRKVIGTSMGRSCNRQGLARGSVSRSSNHNCPHRSHLTPTVHLVMICTRPESECMCLQKLLRTLGLWHWEPRCTLWLWTRSLAPVLLAQQ